MVGPGGLNRAAQVSDQWIMSPPIGAGYQGPKDYKYMGPGVENGVSD